MLDKFYVGRDVTSYSDNGQYHAISKVTLVIDDENSVTAGDDTGIEIQAECPFATQQMANAILNSIKGYRYRSYSAEASNIDPSFELGDGVTVSDIYSVISRIDDSGNGYPSISAPGESELQDEYPIVGPTTQEFNRRIESVKKWAEEHNKELKEEIDESMEEAGKLITGQLGGHYIVTMNPDNGKPNGWALMDTENMETAKNMWMATLGGVGHSSNGINGPFNVALTMDGKVNASMILTGELWANLIKTGRIESKDGTVYFDLDNDELAASRLIDPQGNVYAVVGTDIDLAAEGFFLYKDNEKFAQIYKNGNSAEFLSTDEVAIRSHGGTGTPTNLIFMGKDDNGNGEVYINRANGSDFVTPLYLGPDATFLRNPEGHAAFQADGDNTVLRNPQNGVVFRGNSLATLMSSPNGNAYIQVVNNEIQFVINNAVVAYIDASGIH